MPVAASGLRQADAGSAIFAEPVGENTSGGTGSDNDVVLRGIGHVDRMPASLPIAKRNKQLHNPSIDRASAGVAISRPTSFAMRTISATSAAFVGCPSSG